MSPSDAARVIAETERLLQEVDRHEQEDTAAARRAEMSRPIGPELMAAEAGALRRFSPRRNRWDDVVEFDQRVAGLERRQIAVHEKLLKVHERLAAAPAADQQRLAAWQLAGAKGERPQPATEALEREVAELDADYQALTAAISAVLEQKAAHVVKHRARLKHDANEAKSRAHAELLDAIALFAAARDKVVELRGDELFAELFPAEEFNASPAWQLVAGGVLVPALEALGIKHQVDAARLLDVLRQDADWLKTGASPAQRTALAGRDPRKPPGTSWVGTEEHQAQRVAERQAAREAYRREWGREPGW